MSPGARVLVVEDEGIVAASIRRSLGKLGYDVVGTAATGEEALRLFAEHRPQVVLVDIRLRGGMDGIEAAGRMREQRDVPVVYLTAYSDDSTLARAKHAEPAAYLLKPYEDRELRAAIEIALHNQTAAVERKRAVDEAQGTTRRLVELLDATDAAVYVVDAEGRILVANRGLSSLCGIPKSKAAGQRVDDVLPGPIVTGLRAAERRAVAEARPVLMEGMEATPSGGVLAWTFIPLRGADGRVHSVLAMGRNRGPGERTGAATGGEEFEENVFRPPALIANEDLDAFFHSVSHDLRAPLRRTEALVTALAADHGAELSPDARGYVERISCETRQILRLVTDLLALSRAARGELRREKVDVTGLARLVVAGLQRADPGRVVEVRVEEGLVVDGDAALLWTVVENLVGNAWKYSSRAERPRIEVGASPHANGDGRVLFVRDNGVGFEPSEAVRLFHPFHRLGSSSGFEGCGLGLASVRCAVERHGGRAWAEGRPGEGATFFFTLPDHPDPKRSRAPPG